ncbi:MAG: glycosyltransferase family 2 protein [Candidatus Aenigmatarchaeota archaeon]
MNAVVVIPAYNLENIIGKVVSEAKKYVDVVVGIDIKTKDKTAEEAKKAGAEIILNAGNGKGEVLRTLFKYALNKNYDYIISMDGDYQDKPEEIPNFISSINDYDIINGSRYLEKMNGKLNLFGLVNIILIKTSKINIIGNLLLFFIVNFISFGFNFKSWVTDTQSGYRLFKREALLKILPYLNSRKYEIETETLFFAGKFGLKIKEISKKVDIKRKGASWKDGLRIGYYSLRLWIKFINKTI